MSRLSRLPSVIAGPAYLVPQPLACNNGNLIANALVGLKVEGELWVVSLNDDLGGLLDSLGTNATHDSGIGAELVVEELVVVRSSKVVIRTLHL